MHRKRLLATILSLALLISLTALLLHALQHQPSYPLASGISLKSISMDSSNDGWAVGVISGAPNNVLFHYHAGQWMIIKPLPENTPAMPGIHAELQSVSMLTPNDGWAVGNTDMPEGKPVQSGQTTEIRTQPAGLLFHYVNGKWEMVKTYIWAKFSQISMQSETSGWLLGEDYTRTNGTILLHYNGSQWTNVNVPDKLLRTGPLVTFSALAGNHLWVTDMAGSLYSYDGKTWTQLERACENCVLRGLDMVSPDEGWAVGGIYNSDQGVILHYLDGHWTAQSDATTPGMNSISMLSNAEGWAAGGNGQLFHYSNGNWTEANSPTNQLLSQLATLSSNNVWAVGELGTILHYQSGSWTVLNNITYQQGALESYK